MLIGEQASMKPILPAELIAVWFESSQRWFVIGPTGDMVGAGGSVGEAVGAAQRSMGAAEADFDCIEDRGDFYRYERSECE